MSGAETARRRISGAESAAPRRRRRNGPPPKNILSRKLLICPHFSVFPLMEANYEFSMVWEIWCQIAIAPPCNANPTTLDPYISQTVGDMESKIIKNEILHRIGIQKLVMNDRTM